MPAAQGLEQQAHHQTNDQAEAALQVFVGGVEVQARIEGDEDQNRQRGYQWVANGDPHELDVVLVAPGGRAHDGDGAEIGGDDGDADGQPGHGSAAEKILLGGALAAVEETAQGANAQQVEGHAT